MSGFIYYLSGYQGALTPDTVERVGLGYAFDSAPSCAEVSGPDGKRGLVFADLDRAEPPPLGYCETTQKWRRVPQRSETPVAQAWVGLVATSPPAPSCLRRPKALPGEEVELLDGSKWLIPHAKQFLEERDGQVGWMITLPRAVDINDSGEFVEGDVSKQYRELWRVAEGFTGQMGTAIEEASNKEQSFNVQAHLLDAVRAIQANYYVDGIELAMLSALSIETAGEVMMTLIDWHTFQELMSKKKLSDGLNSANGNSGEPKDTDQLLPI